VAQSIFEFQPRLRFPHAGSDAFGPGKAELLGYIAATGSIRRAASELGMSYQRAWTLVRQMNLLFREPLVSVSRGGGTGGGATLTPAGEDVLARYRRMEESCRSATEADWRALQALLRK
jgi:molybdate transport system regulatory protein